MSINFNEISKKNSNSNALGKQDLPNSKLTWSGDRPRFVQRPNALVDRAYQIFEFNHTLNDFQHVGDYVLINKDESRELTDKKVANLISLLNGKKDLIDISNLTSTRVLYTVIPEARSGDQTKIIFKDYDGSGVSKDNAVFTIRKGVFHG